MNGIPPPSTEEQQAYLHQQACQIDLEAVVKRYEAALMRSYEREAEALRDETHTLLDVLLDAKLTCHRLTVARYTGGST